MHAIFLQDQLFTNFTKFLNFHLLYHFVKYLSHKKCAYSINVGAGEEEDEEEEEYSTDEDEEAQARQPSKGIVRMFICYC